MTAANLKQILDGVIEALDTTVGKNLYVHLALGALRWLVDESGLLNQVAADMARKGM